MSKSSIPEEWKCPHTMAEYRPLICYQCTADDLFLLKSRLNQAYRIGEPVCSDAQYDMYEQIFRDHYPDDERFWKVGQYE
jgi:hypothetical protein